MNKDEKNLEYWKNNCEEDYIKTPLSVLRYISELEEGINYTRCSTELVCDTCDKPAEFVEKKCCECAYADLQ